MDPHLLVRAAPPAAPSRPRRRLQVRLRWPRLSVVVVNYQRWQDTARLVRQLRSAPALRQGAAEVVIVDNHSPAHPVVPRLRRLPGISLRRWRRNRGFARAVNEGVRLSRGDWFLLLNPDMTLPPGFLDRVLARGEELLASRPNLGMVGFGLRNPDGSLQLSTGPFPTLAGTLGRLLLPRERRKYSLAPGTRPSAVDWATGCCLLVRRACWEDLGGLDDDFFLYYEDVDLCRRARARGWAVCHDPGPAAVHHRPLHLRAVPPHLRVITRHALLTYARKHWPAWQFHALAGIVGLEAGLRRCLARLMGDGDGARAFAALGRIVGRLVRGQADQAGRCLRRVVQQQEKCRAAQSVGDHSQPQPAGPAAPVPGQCHPLRPGRHANSRGR